LGIQEADVMKSVTSKAQLNTTTNSSQKTIITVTWSLECYRT